MQRLVSSQNPFLNEFNLIYKDIVNRLPVFESITAITDKQEQQSNAAEQNEQDSNEAYDTNYSTFYEHMHHQYGNYGYSNPQAQQQVQARVDNRYQGAPTHGKQSYPNPNQVREFIPAQYAHHYNQTSQRGPIS